MSAYNAAIIGCGAIHTMHVNAIAKCANVKLAAVVDIDENLVKKVASDYKCDFYTDYKEVLKQNNIDVVHICTPHYLHAPMAIEAMRAGKHVFIEKPMAISVSDAQKMIKVQEETGKILGVCFQNRYNETSIKVKEVLDSGRLGKIIGGKAFVTWHRNQDYYARGGWRGTWEKEGGGVLINQAIHTLDLLQWFIGDVDRIKASVDTRLLKDFIEVEDTAEATVIFKNGATALFYATNCYPVDSPIEIELICEKAVIRLGKDLYIQYKDGESEKINNSDKATGQKAYWGSGHETIIREFYNTLDKGIDFDVDGKQGINAIRIIDAIYRSNKDKQYIYLD